MKSQLANLRSIQLPFDAGPGEQRIVIDGVNGGLTGYDPSGDVLWHLDVGDAASNTGIWSVDSAAGTSLADLEAGEFVRIVDGDVIVGDGGRQGRMRVSPNAHGGLEIFGADDGGFGDPSIITLDCDELRLRTGVLGRSPVITVSGTTNGVGGLTFNHQQHEAPQLILPIMENPVGESVRAVDNITSTDAIAWTSTASSSVTFRALVII